MLYFSGSDQPQSAIFSVSDIFSTRIKASHFTLIACDSASQAIQCGDEPLGIVTALLCAGASSVLGTMWPICCSTGKAFSEEFYRSIREQVDGNSIIDLAIALQEAVIELISHPKTSEPWHWAPFVLHGSWFYHR